MRSSLVKELASAKFDESGRRVGQPRRRPAQIGPGRARLDGAAERHRQDVRVAVFAQGENADKAKAAGADIVGFEDLAETVKGGEMDFDVVIATPDAMRVVGQLGQILGPRGLMPNPKVGTVTADVETAVKNAKAGQVRYRTDKAGIIHCPIGRADFEVPRAERKPRRAAGRPEEGQAGIGEGRTSRSSRCPRPWVRVFRSIRRRSTPRVDAIEAVRAAECRAARRARLMKVEPADAAIVEDHRR